MGGGDDANDERLIVERARSDPEAFGELYRRYLPRIHAFAYRRTGDVEAAEDVTSAAFERALRNLDGFRWQPGGFGAWLFRITANELVDHYRRTGRARRPVPGAPWHGLRPLRRWTRQTWSTTVTPSP